MSSAHAFDSAGERRRFRSEGALAARAYPVNIAVVRTREALEALQPQWLALEAQVPGAVVFQGSGWAEAIFAFEAKRGNKSFDPVIVALREGQRLVAVLPLERIRTRARTVLAPLGHAFGQYSDLLMVPGMDPVPTVAKLLQAAIAAAPCDAVSFLKVRGDSALAKGMPANHLVTGSELAAPSVALADYPDFAAYFATIKAKTRKNMRNARNRLEREAPLSHRIAASADEQLAIIRRTLSGRAGRLRDQGLTSRAFSDTAFSDFCQSLAGRNDVSLMAMSLCHGDTPIAEQWGFVHGGRYYAFVASRDFGNSDESPGKLHLGEVIEACSALGFAHVDLGVPAMPYKLTWATETVPVRDYALPVSPRGALVLQVWDKTLRPALKHAILNMPKPLRAAVMKLSGRGL